MHALLEAMFKHVLTGRLGEHNSVSCWDRAVWSGGTAMGIEYVARDVTVVYDMIVYLLPTVSCVFTKPYIFLLMIIHVKSKQHK